MITIDGESFDVGIGKVTRKMRIDYKNLGQTQDGKDHNIALGTYIDYVVTFITKRVNVAEYNRLYNVLASPVNEHTVTMPYNDTTITFNCIVSVGNDSIVQNFNSFRRWSELQVTFESLEYQIEAV